MLDYEAEAHVEEMVDAQPARRHSTMRTLLLVALVPLVGMMVWLGLLVTLRTTSPLEVTIGRSMQPTLHTGDLAILEGLGPQGVELGDIVPMRPTQAQRDEFGYPERVLHRVIDIRMTSTGLVVKTKGDNEATPDPFEVPASDIETRLKFSVPKVGFILFYLRSTQGQVALAGLVLLFVLYEGIRWVTDTAEELIEEDGYPIEVITPGLDQFTTAMGEYGLHLMSHTKVVQELGGTTEELRRATQMQREVLAGLRDSVFALSARVGLEPPALLPLEEPVPRARPARLEIPRRPAAVATGPLARPAVFVDTSRAREHLLEILVQGTTNPDGALEFGRVFDADPFVVDVGLEMPGEDSAYFTVATSAPARTVERLRGLTEFSVHVVDERPEPLG